MKKHNIWKKFAAGLLALALVTGGLPANVGGFLTRSTEIVAYAAETKEIGVNVVYAIGDKIKLSSDTYIVIDDGNSSSNGVKCKQGEYDIPEPQWIGNTTNQWMFEHMLPYADRPGEVNVWLGKGTANGSETVTGIKVVSGEGTQSSPYILQLVFAYPLTTDTVIPVTAENPYVFKGDSKYVTKEGTEGDTKEGLTANDIYALAVNGNKLELRNSNNVLLANVADIPENYAGTVYISGEGTTDSPFVLTPNVIYSSGSHYIPEMHIGDIVTAGATVTHSYDIMFQKADNTVQKGGGYGTPATITSEGTGTDDSLIAFAEGKNAFVYDQMLENNVAYFTQTTIDTVKALTTGTVIPISAGESYGFVVGEDAYISTSSGNVSLSPNSEYELNVSNGKIMLIGLDIDESEVAELPTFFANTAYISGAGTSDSPFVISPNQIYTSTFDSASIHPGDILAIGAQTALSGTVYISGDGTNVATYSNDTHDKLLVTATGLAAVKDSTESSPENAPTFTDNNNAFIFMGIDQINETDTYLLSQTTIFDILPASVQNLKYTGQPQTLITAGLSSTGATMKYSLSNVIDVATDTTLVLNDIKVGCVYHPTGTPTITLPAGYQGIISLYYEGYHLYSYVDEERSIKDFFEAASDYGFTGDSLRVTKVDTDSKKIYFDFVSVSDYANCWGTDLPKGTDPGAYTVFYKMVKDALESEIDTVSVTIGKGVLDITATANTNIKYDGAALDASDFTFTGTDKALAANAKVKELIEPDLKETLAIGNYLKKNTTYDIGALDSLDETYLILPYTEGTYSFKLSERATRIEYYCDTENIFTGKFTIDNDGELIYTRGDGNGNWDAEPTTVALEEGKQWYCQLRPNGDYQIVQKVPDADIINVGNHTATITIPAPNANYEEKVLTVENVTIGMGENGWETAPTLASNQTYSNKAIQLIKTAGVPKYDTSNDVHYIAIKDDETAPTTETEGWNTYEYITADSAGKYYIYYQTSSGDNWNAVGPELIGTVTISKYTPPTYYSQSWDLSMDSYVYDGTAHTPKFIGDAYGEITYTYYNADTDEELSEAPIEPGNYKVEVFAEGGMTHYTRTQWATYSILEPIGTDGKADVAVYKDNDVQPESEGKIFAGWFTDSTCTTPFTGDSGKAYAKFIDEKILTVKAQISGGTTANSEKTSIRFITSVDSLKYQNVGFKITFNGKTINPKMTKVYTTINASGVKVKPTVFSEDSKYMEAYTLKNIPNDAFGQAFTVTPYYTTQDGTVVEGETKSFTIANMIK